MSTPSFFLVPAVLFGLVLPLSFHAAILDAVELTGIGVEVFLLAPAAAAIASISIAVDTVHVGTLTLTEVLLGFQLAEALGIDGIDALHPHRYRPVRRQGAGALPAGKIHPGHEH